MSAGRDLRDEVIEEISRHALGIDLGTPRQYTQHGGWNRSCACGEYFGDDEDEASRDFDAHLAEAVLAVVEPRIRAEALRDVRASLERFVTEHEFFIPTECERDGLVYSEHVRAFAASTGEGNR